MGAPNPAAQLAVRRCLIDTGPCVAYLDRRDPRHARVAAELDAFAGQLLTTPAVVTEVMHFLSAVPEGPAAFAEFLTLAGVQLSALDSIDDVAAAVRLMADDSDTPMDFADATLVRLADASGVTDIFTLDRRGFSAYRTAKGKRFRVRPAG